VRLAAKLTGWRIDIKSEEEKRKEVEAQFGALETGDAAAGEASTEEASIDASADASTDAAAGEEPEAGRTDDAPQDAGDEQQ